MKAWLRRRLRRWLGIEDHQRHLMDIKNMMGLPVRGPDFDDLPPISERKQHPVLGEEL